MKSVETITDNGATIAIILYKNGLENGLWWATKPDDAMQLGVMRRPAGYVIKRHRHLVWQRRIAYTFEALFVREGAVDVELYSTDQKFICRRNLIEGDVILLMHGGHEFRFRRDSELVEVKQGPHVDVESDKEWF